MNKRIKAICVIQKDILEKGLKKIVNRNIMNSLET